MNLLFDLEPEFLALYEQCREHTMTSIERMYALYNATRYLAREDIPGHLVECGVWRGGSVMMMALTLLQCGIRDRELWLYDTFTGMTPPSAEDVEEMSGRSAGDILAEHDRSEESPFWGIAGGALVETNVRRTGYPLERVHFVEGDVRVTIPAQGPDEIALLRLDTDWYETTRHELEHFYPRIAGRGVLIIDDYGYWRGARKATDDYFDSRSRRPLLQRIDCTGRICVKTG